MRIRAGGVVPYIEDDESLRVLLLQNRETGLWEPPKGICEPSEGVFASAQREFQEETSLPLPATAEAWSAPTDYDYVLPDGRHKQVDLFPCRMPKAVEHVLRLSREHRDARWVSPAAAAELLGFDNIRAAILGFAERRSRARRLNRKRDEVRAQVLGGLRQTFRESASLVSGWTWYLGGSVASGEHTVGESTLLSDVDLVAVGNEIYPSHRLFASIQNIERSLQGLCNLDRAPSVSAIGLGDMLGAVEPDEPFWTHFVSHPVPLSNRANGPPPVPNWTSGSVGSARQAYRVFRLAWYTLVEEHVATERRAEDDRYRWSKAVITAQVIDRLIVGEPFQGYAKIRTGTVEELAHCGRDGAEQLYDLFSALDEKLEHLPASRPPGPAAFLRSVRRLLDSLGGYEDDATILTRTLLAVRSGDRPFPAGLASVINATLGQEGLRAWDSSLARDDLDLQWLVLCCCRLARWPQEVRWSTRRYTRLFERLAAGSAQRSLIKPLRWVLGGSRTAGP